MKSKLIGGLFVGFLRMAAQVYIATPLQTGPQAGAQAPVAQPAGRGASIWAAVGAEAPATSPAGLTPDNFSLEPAKEIPMIIIQGADT